MEGRSLKPLPGSARDIATDRAEPRDLAAKDPERGRKPSAQEAWAPRAHALPWPVNAGANKNPPK